VTTQDEERIHRAWMRALGRRPGAERALRDLLERYREPHRRYHGIRHVARVLDDVERIAAGVGLPADHGAVLLAVCFHDAVYEPRRSTNESDSAALARRVLVGLGVDESRIAEIERLVLATAAHEPIDPERDPPGAVLLDADLAILGSAPSSYAAYVVGVRAEYAHVDDAAWRAGRATVIDHFLARAKIFCTPVMAPAEARARTNLTAERAALVSTS
jgi:predicted metal-dependent HD superfamily phosphohydrolase